jgi:hypothetical protein
MAVVVASSGAARLNAQPADSATNKCDETTLYCPVASTSRLASTLKDFPAPELKAPINYFATAQCGNNKPASGRVVKYQITTKGTITASFSDFMAKVQETYDNSCGWKRLGVTFQKVASGGEYTIVLSQASQVPSFGGVCDSTYSCRSGNYVVINQDRWQGATSAWNNAGGDLRNYRHMVVNHETGHWLGHGHTNCVANSGNAAPVMQQQSIDLRGCKFNPWPLNSEIWSTKLGI